MSDQDSVKTQETHKEESKSRMQAHAADRKVIREKLEQCINPLAINSETYRQQLVNIVSGRVVPALVNVDNAVDIGTKQMELSFKNMASGFLWTHLKNCNNDGCHQETCQNWCSKDL